MPSSNSGITDDFVSSYLTALDCPRSLSVLILYRHRQFEDIVSLEFDPMLYNDLKSARDSLAATAFLSKSKFLPLKRDLKQIALDKAKESEALCKETNSRIRNRRFSNDATDLVLTKVRRKILSILGSHFNADSLLDACGWGPGATTSVKRSSATAPNKFHVSREATPELYDFIKPWFDSAFPNWKITDQIKVRAGCKVITVPKNAKTDRTIAIEPDLNLWFQKGIGALLRRRFRYYGIDLDKQHAVNQRLACDGSARAKLCTVDFSSASDTISNALVEEILPTRWFSIMDISRSRLALFDSVENVYLHKFSSMGNGFTFELESIIFYSIAWVVTRMLHLPTDNISVFGDDIILPVEAYSMYASVCEDLGFRVNQSKSFSTGYYRESCGSHYWDGICIKPLFQKEKLHGKTALLKCVNSIRRIAHRRNYLSGCDINLLGTFSLLSDALGQNTPRISDGFGDVGIIENFDHPRTRVRRAKSQHEGWDVRVWLTMPVMVFYDHHGLLLTKLKQCGGGLDVSYGNDTPVPMRTRMIRKNLRIPRWYDLGPWC